MKVMVAISPTRPTTVIATNMRSISCITAVLPSHDAADDHQADGCDNRQRRKGAQGEHDDLVFCFPIHRSISCCCRINNAELDIRFRRNLTGRERRPPALVDLHAAAAV